MATRSLLSDLAGAARAAGLPPVEIESVGGVDAEARVAAGEPFDLVVLAAGALDRLAVGGHLDAATVTPLVRSQVAVAVPEPGAPAASDPGVPAFADAAAVRSALRTAGRIGYSTGPSGTALARMIEAWDLGSEIEGRLLQARPGVPVTVSLAAGDVDLGFQQLSELVGQPGVRILGVLPPDCAIDTIFSGAVTAASVDPMRAADVLGFFVATADAGGVALAHSFDRA